MRGAIATRLKRTRRSIDPGDPVEIWEYEKATLPIFITLDENSSGNSTKMMRVL